jgi:hypothetical protein
MLIPASASQRMSLLPARAARLGGSYRVVIVEFPSSFD